MLRQVQSKLVLLDGPTLDTLSAKAKTVNAVGLYFAMILEIGDM